MKFTNLTLAESYRDRACEPLMIVLMDGYVLVTTRKKATTLEKQGYEVY
jgi:hypothetical protein